jgi:hypothetical protein
MNKPPDQEFLVGRFVVAGFSISRHASEDQNILNAILPSV